MRVHYPPPPHTPSSEKMCYRHWEHFQHLRLSLSALPF